LTCAVAAREWLVPLLLAVLAAGALSLVHPRAPAAPASAPDSVLPFADGRADRGNLTFLLVAPHGRARAEAALGTPPADATMRWRADRLAFVTRHATDLVCRPPCAAPDAWPQAIATGADLIQDHGPRLGAGGYNATSFTAYVFDSGGALVSSNAPDADQARFTRSPDFRALPGGAWYFGDNGTPPPGTVDPPPLAGPIIAHLLPQLEELPEGGVASDTSNALVSIYGTLFVTVRIDHLVHAP